jgi:hypothetical protein
VVVVKGSPQVVVDVAGFGQIRASGPAGSIEELRAELESATSKLAKLVQPFGGGTIEELAHRAEQSTEIEKEIDHADATRTTLLGDEAVEELEQTRGRAEKVIASLSAQHPQWMGASPDPVAMKDQLRTRTREHELKLKAAELEWEQATQVSKDASAAVQTHAAKIEASAKREQDCLQSLARHEADGLDDAKRREQAKQLALAWSAANAQLDEARKQLAEFGVNPGDELSRVQRTLDALQQQSTRSLEDEKRAEGRLERIAHLGAWSRLGEV